MKKARKIQSMVLVPVVEAVPRISAAQRKALRTSLEKARTDIADGNFDVVTAAKLRGEFESVFRRRAFDDSATDLPRHAGKRKRR